MLPKIQRLRVSNFGSSGSILTTFFPYDVPQARGNNLGTILEALPPKIWEGKKPCKIFRDFWKLSTLIANISGTAEDIQNRQSYKLWQFLLRLTKKVR